MRTIRARRHALELPIPTPCCEWLGRAAEAHGALARQDRDAVDGRWGCARECERPRVPLVVVLRFDGLVELYYRRS